MSVLHFKFSNPERGSSFGIEDARFLLKSIHQKNYSGLLLSGEIGQKTFCAGGDLKAYSSLKTKSQGLLLNAEIAKILKQLKNLNKPKVCVITGDCFGGGIELISCFDQIYSVPHAFFGLWQRRVGLSPGWGGGQRLTERLTNVKTIELLSSARTFDAYEAQHIGLVDQILPENVISDRACSWLEQHPTTARLNTIDQEKNLFKKLWFNPEHKKKLFKPRES